MRKTILLPEQVAIPGGAVTLRPEQPGDVPFLRALFSTAASLPEGLPPAMAETLLDMQWRGQTASYRAAYPQAHYLILMRAETPCGRLICDFGDPACIVDYALLPSCRGSGIGTAVLRAVLASIGAPVRSTVRVDNHASLAMCQRLGFTVVAQDQVFLRLQWRPLP